MAPLPVRRARHWIKRQFASRALVLMYHRVTELSNDPYLLAVTPDHFAEQLEVIRRYYHPIRLEDLAQAVRERRIPKRAIVITFDDGYADNLCNAKPLLESSDIPATVFVTTGHIGSRCEFWWDELDRLLLQPGKLPSNFEWEQNGQTRRWELGTASVLSGAMYDLHRDWHVERQDDPSLRQSLFRSIYEQLHAASGDERQHILSKLETMVGAEPYGRPTHRILSREQVIELARGDLVEIGAHTVSHPALAAISVAEQQMELEQSKRTLEGILNRPVTGLAYPHGSYSPETIAVAQAAGFSYACSSDTSEVESGADAFRLPRFAVRDWDGDTFAGWLKERFGE